MDAIGAAPYIPAQSGRLWLKDATRPGPIGARVYGALAKLLDKYVQGEVSLIEIQSHTRWLRSEWMVAKRKKGGYSTRAGRLE